MEFALTTDFLPALISGAEAPQKEGVVLQVVENQLLKSNVAGSTEVRERYRVVLSDGANTYHAMLATQLNHLITNSTIRANTIVKLVKFSQHTVQDKRLLIITELHVLDQTEEKIITAPKVEVKPDVKPVAVARSYPAPNSPSAFSAGASNTQGPSSPWAQQSNRLAQSGRGPVSDSSGSAILPIASITAYQSRWTIKARCTSKAPVKTYRNAKGDGKLMSVEFSDAQGSSIRATMFNATVDKFDPILEIGKVYLCSNMQAKPANKQFNNTGHEYELTVNDSSTIMPVEDDSSIKEISYNLTGIADLVNLSAGASTDVLGIVSNVGAVSSITTKKGEPLSRRTVSLYDQTSKSVDITLWGEMADSMNEDKLPINSVVLFKAARVSEYQGRSLNSGFGSTVMINPRIEEASALLGWSQAQAAQGGALQIDSLSGRGGVSAAGGGAMTGDVKTVAQITSEGLGMKDRPDYFVVRGVVTFIRHEEGKQPFYQACPNETQAQDPRTGELKTQKCGKKVQAQDGRYRCEKCGIDMDTYEARYILSFAVADSTGSVYMSAFNEVGPELLSGKSANEMERLLNESPAAYEAVFSESLYKQFMFKCRAKAEQVQDELRNKVTVLKCMPMNFESDCRTLLSSLQQIYK